MTVSLTFYDTPSGPSSSTEVNYDGKYNDMVTITRVAEDGARRELAVPFKHLHSMVGEFVRRSKITELMQRSDHDILQSPFVK